MKKLLIVFVSFFCVMLVHAQKSKPISLNLFAGYVFQDRVQFDGFTGYAREGFQYGGGLEFLLETVSLDIKYLRQDTRFPLYGPAGVQLNTGKDKGSVNYILLGATNYFLVKSGSKAIPYAGLGAGIGIVDSKEGESATKFAWDGRLGVQIKTSSKVSFKLQATFQSIISAIGSDFYVSSGGAVIAVPDYATLFQFGLGGGLCFTF